MPEVSVPMRGSAGSMVRINDTTSRDESLAAHQAAKPQLTSTLCQKSKKLLVCYAES